MRNEPSIGRAMQRMGLMAREIARLEAVRLEVGDYHKAAIDRRIEALAAMRFQLIRDVGLGMPTPM